MKVKDAEVFVSSTNSVCFMQEKQTENKELRRKVENLEKAMKDLKAKSEYALHSVK